MDTVTHKGRARSVIDDCDESVRLCAGLGLTPARQDAHPGEPRGAKFLRS